MIDLQLNKFDKSNTQLANEYKVRKSNVATSSINHYYKWFFLVFENHISQSIYPWVDN